MNSQTHTSVSTVRKIKHTWEIENFDIDKMQVGEKVVSEISVDLYKMKWILAMYPKSKADKKSSRYSTVIIKLTESEQFPLTAAIKFSILDEEGDDTHENSLEKIFRQPDKIGFTYIESRKLKYCLNQNKLTISCKIRLDEPSLSGYQWCQKQLSEDLKTIMKNETLSDICLTLSGHKFNVHKVILSARSPVFAALFSTDMKEKNENVIQIQDDDLDAFKEMLNFMYTGQVNNLNQVAFNLFTLSDKYQLNDLKKVCEPILRDNITIDNVLAVLLLADYHELVELKAKAMFIIAENLKSLVNSEKFIFFEKTHPSLVGEILRTVANVMYFEKGI